VAFAQRLARPEWAALPDWVVDRVPRRVARGRNHAPATGPAALWQRHRAAAVTVGAVASAVLAAGGLAYAVTGLPESTTTLGSGRPASPDDRAPALRLDDWPGNRDGGAAAAGSAARLVAGAAALPSGPRSARLRTARPAGEAAVRRLAAAFGLTGPVRTEPGSWQVGGTPGGAGPVLQVARDAPGAWTYSRYGTSMHPDHLAAGGPAAPEDARRAAAPVLTALGLTGDRARVDATGTAGVLRTVTADPVVGGLPTHGWATVLRIAQDGRAESAQGTLGATGRGAAYPVVSARRALAELNAAGAAGGLPGCARGQGSGAGAAGVSDPAGSSGSPDGAAAPSSPASPSAPASPAAPASPVPGTPTPPAPSPAAPGSATGNGGTAGSGAAHGATGGTGDTGGTVNGVSSPAPPPALARAGAVRPASYVTGGQAAPVARSRCELTVRAAEFGLSAHPVSGVRTLVPSWLFRLADGTVLAEPAVNPSYIARGSAGAPATGAAGTAGPGGVAGTPPAGSRGGGSLGAANDAPKSYTVSADGRTLRVSFFGGVCDSYSGSAVESARVVRVRIVAHREPGQRMCPMLARRTSVSVELARPLGHRRVLDAVDGSALPRG
jgi:hypothetical protein